MASPFRNSRPARSLVGRLLMASVGALLLVLLLLGAAIAAALTLQPQPFSWEGPEGQEANVRAAMHFDERGRLSFIALPAGASDAFDMLTKDMAFQVLDVAGAEVFTSPPGPALDALRALPPDVSRRMARVAAGGVPLQVLTTVVDRGGRRYLVRDARSERLSLGIRSSGSAIVYGAAAGTGVLAILVFSAIAWWMARRVVEPLRQVSDAAAAIRPDNLTQRLDADRLPREIVPLIAAFNDALDRLEEGFAVQQDFLAAAAHELKTPLSLMRAEIELGNVANRDLVLADIDLMATQVRQLLQLAEVSERRNFRFEDVDLQALLAEVVAYAARFAEARSVHLRLVVEAAPAPLRADRGAVAALARNLLENAVHHSPTGGVVTLTLSADGFDVADDGPGVAPEDVPRLFTRFWRSASAPHPGAGLGLSICQRIALAHAWTLNYRPGAGGGALFRVGFRPDAGDQIDPRAPW